MTTQEYQIDLREIFVIIRKKLWIVALLVVLCTTAASIVSFFFLDKVYQASTTLIVTKKDGTELQHQDLMLNQRLVNTYSEIVRSRAVADEVMRKLRLNMNHGNFASKVQVSSIRDTEVIVIRVEDTNPQLAASIANELSTVFMGKVVTLVNIDNVKILDTAVVPSNPIKPNPKLNIAIAAVLGAMLGLGIIFLIEFLDDRLKSVSDVEKHLKLPVLASIPQLDEKEINIKLITHNEPKSPVSEAYRMLRTNLQFSNLDGEMKTILLTSTGPSEGKSTTISNLAVTMVNMGHKTLLIDCDLRKPTTHKIFGLSNLAGMTNVLLGENLEDVVQKPAGLELDILTSGPIPPNPSELLGSKKMRDFLEHCKSQYDIILIDTPPVGAVTDGVILSTIVDGTIYVVSTAEVKAEQAKKGIEMLNKVKAKIIGVSVNKINIDKRRYQNYYNYYYSSEA